MHCLEIGTHSTVYSAAQRLLESYGLDTSDITDKKVKLWSMENAGELIGVVGFEKSQDVGLLRSLAVSQRHQNAGIAKRLCNVVFNYAKTHAIDDIYLLTETAAGFFSSLGFTEISRKNTPAALTATSQFSQLCPASATVMVKQQPPCDSTQVI